MGALWRGRGDEAEAGQGGLREGKLAGAELEDGDWCMLSCLGSEAFPLSAS